LFDASLQQILVVPIGMLAASMLMMQQYWIPDTMEICHAPHPFDHVSIGPIVCQADD